MTDKATDVTVTQADEKRADDWAMMLGRMGGVILDQSQRRGLAAQFAAHRTAHSGECREDVDYWNEIAQRLGHESVCEALEKLAELQDAGEGRSNGAGEDDLRLARGTVEAYLVERLRGEGYGPARRIIDARKYDPTSDDYWVNAEAKNNHRVTPLAALSAPQGEVERLREALGDQIADAVEGRIATEFKGFWAREDLVDEIPGMIREAARAALKQQPD